MNQRTMGVAAAVWGAALACGVSRAGAETAAPPSPSGFTGVASEAAADPNAAGFVADDWTLVWADEFDADGPPDPAHWEFDLGLVRNRELQLYTDRLENARVEGGVLVIEAHQEQVPNPGYDPAAPEAHWQKSWETVPYTSAAVQSRGRHAMTYGRIAVRAKLPEGRGMWPAIWMLAEDYDGAGGDVPWPRCGEIDIMEYVGHVPDTVHVAVHTDARNHRHGNHPANRMKVDRLHEDFHTYAVQWDAEKIDFFIDDTRLMTYANDGADFEDPVSVWPFDQPHYLIMNIAVGGGWGGQQGVDNAIFPQRMEIDWVPASVVFRDDRSMCFMGIRPSSPGECMVIPLSHIDHVTDLDEDLAAHLMRVAHRVGRRMREAFLPQRVGYVVHGYGVAHAHLLIVPQHGPHDITSGKFARVHAGEVVFSLDGVPVTPRETLDRQAQMLRIDGPGVPQQGTH